ncbi:MAG TPA: cytochrome c [Alphaproteobacteria bacterium]|nr:cytochrome c [Alphaproteobacteria bacterium]
MVKSSRLLASAIVTASLGAAILGAQASSAAQTPQGQVSERTSAWYAGRVEFMDHCAACHGMDGKGNGPVAALMTVTLPDLTKLSARHDGEFPFDYVAASIDGRKLPKAHGSLKMPVWGKRYSEGRNDRVGQTQVHAHIYELMMYLSSIQEKSTASADQNQK